MENSITNTPNEEILLAQLHHVQRALEEQYAARREQEAIASACVEKLEILEKQLADTSEQLQAIITSRTWRFTTPLRRLKERLK